MPQTAPLPVALANVASQSSLNLTAGSYLIVASRIGKLSIMVAGTAGNWQVYDFATVAGVGAANLVWQAAFGSALVAVGSLVNIDFPIVNDIVLVVPTTGVAALSFK